MNAVWMYFRSGILEAPWAERVGWALFHSLWQVALIAGVHALAVALLRKRSAQARYLCGCAALVAMLVAPVATWLLLPGGGDRGAGGSEPKPVVAEVAELSPPAFAIDPVAPRLPETVVAAPAVMPAGEVIPAPVAGNDPATPAPVDRTPVVRRWLPWATVLWLLGVCGLSLRPVLGWLHTRRLQRLGLTPLSDSLGRTAGRLARLLGVPEAVRFMQSALVEVPTVVGSLRPLVLLPGSAVTGLSVAQLEMILAHELAHIRRHDYLVNLGQTVLEALLFYHPAMWWVSRQVRRERENCCDDIAVAVSGNREHYVQALTRLEEQRAAGSVVALAATGGSLLDRARRLLGQPGAEFGYRSAAAWLAGLVAVGVVTLALATGDAPREKAGNGSADEVGQEDAAPAPVEHEAVMVVREFLKATASGDFDRAVGLSTRHEFKREGLAEVAKSFDLSKADIAEALVGAANAAVLTQRLAARGEAKPGQFGFDLVSEHDRWLIRDVDFLPDDQAVEKWLADFRELEPGARPAEAGPRSAEQQSDREAMLAYARALAAGDLETLGQTWKFQDDLDRQFAEKLAGMFARAEEMRVELVSTKPLGDETLFACFLMRDGPAGFGSESAPHFATFQREDGRWRCTPPWNLRTIVNARTMGADQMGRRAITQEMIALRFGPQDREERIASRKAQAEAFARLARPPFQLTGFERVAEQMQAAIGMEEKTSGRSWQELWRLTLEEHGKDALPRPDDFHLSFYLPADPDDPHARKLPFPGREKTFLAEPFPCLTDEALLKASVESVPGSNPPQIAIRLNRWGAGLLAAITRQSVRKRLAIVIDGKVISAPEIMTEIGEGRLMITGDFSRQEAEAMVKQMNSCREKAAEFLQTLDKEEGASNRDAGSPTAVNRIIDREPTALIEGADIEPGGVPGGGVPGGNPDNPLGLDNEALIRLFNTGKTLRAAAQECIAYQAKHAKVPASAEVLFEDDQQFAKDMIVDPFAAQGGVLRVTRRVDGPDDDWLQVWSVGPDGDWDGGRPIDAADPKLNGDLGAEMRIGKWAFHWLADKTMAMHLDGKRLSHYLAAQGPEYPGAINPRQTLDWGPVVDGLCMAVKLVPQKEAYALGEKIELEFHIRNVSRRPITIAGFSWRQDGGPDSFVIRNEQGDKLSVSHIFYSGRTPIQREILRTGRVAVFKSSALAFLAQEMSAPEHPVGHTVVTTPGRHTLQFELIFPDGGSSGPDGMPRPTDWQGTLRTGEVAVVIEAHRQAMRPGPEAAAAAAAAERIKERLTSPEFAGVTAITFHNDLGGDRFVEVTEPEEVRELIAAIELTPKEPCLCEHMWSATFHKQGAETKVAICDHCFDIQGDRPAKHFQMPPGFFRLFAKHTGWPAELKQGDVPGAAAGDAPDRPAGKPGGDVQVRLHSPQAQWDDGRWTLFFKTDLESETERVLPHYGAPLDEFFLEIEGEWFEEKDRGAGGYRSVAPSPARQRRDLHTRICAREWRSMATGLPMPEFAPGRHTVRIGFPLADKPDASGQRPRAVSDPVEIVTATKEDGETTIELRGCLGRITTRIGKLKGQYRELEDLDDVKLGGSIAATPDNPLHLGFDYRHKFDGWDNNKHVRIGDGGCLIQVRFGSPDNPSAMMASVPLPRFGKLEARYLVLDSGGEGGPAGKFYQAVTKVIREELEKLRDGGPEASRGKPGEGVQVRLTDAGPVWGRSDWPHPVLRLRYEARNNGSRILQLPENGLDHQVEIDGRWYEWVDPPAEMQKAPKDHVSKRGGKLLDFGPGAEHGDGEIELAGNWRAIPKGREEDYAARWYSGYFANSNDDHGEELVLKPGRHRTRIAVICPSARAPFHGVIRAVSNAREVELGMAPEAPDGGKVLPKEIRPILQAMKQEVAKLGEEYPQLAGAGALEVKSDQWIFEHDCRFMGKRGFENTGPFPVAVGLRVMTVERFRTQLDKVAMSAPGSRWDYLGLVGWPTLHVGEGVPPVLTGMLQEVLRSAMVKIGHLNRQALADSLPAGIKKERDSLLAAADAKIRDGVRKLAETWPLLRKGQWWDRLEVVSDPGRIGIHVHRTQAGKGRTDAQEFPPSEAFSILVVVKQPPDEIGQLATMPLYPRLGLVGQVGTRAANPALDAALKKLVTDALAPLAELEERTSKPAAGPLRVAPAESESDRGRAEAEADLKAGRARYFHIGLPLSADSQLADILLKDYGLTLVGLGCVPVPPVGEHAKGYNETIIRELGQKFGRDFIQKAWKKDSALRQEAGKPKGPGGEVAPNARDTDDDAGQTGDDHRPVNLADAAGKLTAAVGEKWMVAKRERGPGLGRELWCSFSAWHGVQVPYGILPFPASDAGGRAKLDAFLRECSAALEVIASDDRWTLVAGPAHEADVTSRILQVLGMKMSKEAEQRRRATARADWLDFRLAVAREDNPPSAAQIADSKELFARKGPNGGRHRGDPYLWFPRMDICDSSPAMVHTTSEDGAQTEYLLLGDKPGEVLLSGSARPRPWHLKRVDTNKDDHGRISITLGLDETSALRMQELTAGKEGRPLAVLFDDRIIAVEAIHEQPNDRIVLAGGDKGFDDTLAGRIVRSLSECMLREEAPIVSKVNLRSGSLKVEMEAGPVAPAMPFEQLKVVMRCNWWGNLRRELTIRGDGRAVYAMVPPGDESTHRAEFHLSGGQREALVRALTATRWLADPPEKIMADDAVEYELVLDREGQTKRAEFMVQRKPPYQALEMFLNCLDRQEDLFCRLTASTAEHRVHAARDIQNELSSRMKHPGRAPAAHLKDLDFTRFVPVLIPCLKDRENHGTDEMAAAIDLVGYLKLAGQREAVEALMGLDTYGNWNSVCECLVRLGDPRSIPVLKKRALKPGADAACWALIRMGAAAEAPICEVLGTPRVPDNNPAYKMVRVYLDHFHELPEPVAPAIVEAIRAARLGGNVHPISEYADRLLGLVEGGHPMLDLRVTIAPQKHEYAPGEPVLVKWKIENTAKEARTILWHPLHYSPVVFSFKTAGGTEYDRADLRRNIVDELPAPPEPLVLQPGGSHEANIDLRHFLPDGASTWLIAGYYWPRAREAAIPAEFLNDSKFADAVLDRVGSGVARIVVPSKSGTTVEEEQEAERRAIEKARREEEE